MSGLNLIYHFQSSQNQDKEFRPASYKVVYFFNDEGFVSESILLELLKSFPEANGQDMTFLNLDDLKAFAMRVGQEIQSSQIKLISVQDYNIGIDGAKDLKTFRELFDKYGEALINENAPKKKGLLGKLFS
jgi:hypothetical protein